MIETEVFKPIQKKDALQNGNHRFEKRKKQETEITLKLKSVYWCVCRNEEAEPKGEVFKLNF